MRFIITLLFVCFLAISGISQTLKQAAPNQVLLEQLMQSKPEQFASILANRDSLNVQIIYTQIRKDKQQKPIFTDYHFNVQRNRYFYPASTVKMPVAFLALEKLHELNIPGLNRNSTMVTDSSFNGQDAVYNQPNAPDGRPTIENYIKQILLVSDNDAFNRLYEFVGQETIQKKLSAKGYTDAAIRHRLDVSRTIEQNQQTNAIYFYDTKGKLLYHQPAQISKAVYPVFQSKLGKGYYSAGKLVNNPFSFAEKNRVYLEDLHHMLQSVLFPEAFDKKQQFNLSGDDRTFLLTWLQAYPGESSFPNYDTSHYWNTYCKFLFYGSEPIKPLPHIRIFNKVGDAYGFLTDIAYITDQANDISFMLSATILCNKDGIFNDNRYDYDSLGFPFMKAIGQLVYEYELSRKKQ